MSRAEQFAIDLSRWGNKDPIVVTEDTASFVLEAGNRPPEKRVNPGTPGLEEFGRLIKKDSDKPEDIATSKIFQWACRDRPAIKIWTKDSSFSNKEVINSLLSFTDSNPGSVMVWISPPLQGVYQESRIVIYQVIKINDRAHLFYRAICSYYSENECLEISRKLTPFITLGESLNQISTPEELRATPLPLTIPPNESYSHFFDKIIRMPEVWQAIATGEDIKEKIKALEVAEEVVRVNYGDIQQALTFEDQLIVGKRFEQSLQWKMGFNLSPGPCGILYSGLIPLGLMNDFLHSGTQKGETSKFIHNCGACGRTLNKYMSKGDHCPYCGGTYEGC